MKSKFYTRFAMVIGILMMFAYVVSAQTTIQAMIVAGIDDMEETMTQVDPAESAVGDVDPTSSDLEIPFDHEPQFIAMRFSDVQIPAGSQIMAASIQFAVDEVDEHSANPVPVTIVGQPVADAAELVDAPFAISSLTQTTASVMWTPGPSVAEGDQTAAEKTADIAAVVQEIVDVAGWAAGNHLMIIIKADPAQTENNGVTYESYDGDPALAAVLSVTYVEGTGISTTKEFTYSVYPNPTEGQVYISNPSSNDFSYEIFNINGQLVASRYNLTGSSAELDVSAFAKGMYFVDVTSAEGVETHKLILK